MIGERGELICKTPFPSMPTHFLDDPGRQKYHKAYFAKFAGVWAHGDFLIVNPRTGGYIMLGRSDGTLNPGGVRFGSAEIYQVGKINSLATFSISIFPSKKQLYLRRRCAERVSITFLQFMTGLKSIFQLSRNFCN